MSYGYDAYVRREEKPPFTGSFEGDRNAVQGYGNSQTRGFQEGTVGVASQQHTQVKSGYSQHVPTGRNRDTGDTWQSWGSMQDSASMAQTGPRIQDNVSMATTGQRMQENLSLAPTGQLHRCELCNIGFNEKQVMFIVICVMHHKVFVHLLNR